MKDWVASQEDCANTNKVALTLIEKTCDNVKVSRNYCCSHTLSNDSKLIIGGKDVSVEYAENFRKYF